MKKSNSIHERIFSREEIKQEVLRLRLKSKTIAFTNGVFDILHEGHIAVLSKAASFADVLIVGINSDSSVKKIKRSISAISVWQEGLSEPSNLS